MSIEPIAHPSSSPLLLQAPSKGSFGAKPGCSSKLDSVSTGVAIAEGALRRPNYPSGACVPQQSQQQFQRKRAANDFMALTQEANSHSPSVGAHSMSVLIQAEIAGAGSQRTPEEHLSRTMASFALLWHDASPPEGSN
jgi:hypothetical protein